MITNPFKRLQQFPQLQVTLLTKEDQVRTDEDVQKLTGISAIASLHQMHGANIVRAEKPTSRTLDADGMATDRSGLLLAIRAADCQNFVVYSPSKNVVGVMHVGWKGILAGTIDAFYDFLKREWGIEPGDTFVGAGPSLCTKCADFTDPKRELPTVDERFIHGRTVDLRAVADARFESLGVPKDHRERMSGCTRCDPKGFWTYRGGDGEAVKQGWTNVLCAQLS